MPFVENSVSFTAGGDGVYSGNYAKAKVKVTSSGGKVNWTITMETPANGSGNIPLIRIEFKIDNQTIYDRYWDNYGQGFPCKNGSTASGSVTLKDSDDTSIPIVFNIGVNYKDKCQYEYSKTLKRTYYTNIGDTKTVITDNYDNTFNIKATKGAAGTNNPSTLTNLEWGYSSSYGKSYANGETIPLTISGTAATRIVYANAFTEATHGYGNGNAVSKEIRQYIGPNQPTGLKLSYNKNRFTLGENWTLSWTAATAANSSSPVKGYRIRLYRKRGTGNFVKLPIFRNDGWYLSSKVISSGDIYYDRDNSETSTPTSITIYPEYYTKDIHPDEPDILPGDIIKFAVTAYTRYGKENTGEQLFKTSETFSSEYTVENAGIMRVKAGGSWKEGQVWIKTNGSWKEAESVHIKTGGAWKESQ